MPPTKKGPAVSGKRQAASRLWELLLNGLWAWFFCCVAVAALIVLAKAGSLPAIVEDFQGDSYDTILSVKFFREYGPFGNVPGYTAPYSMFGVFPLLFAFLASVIDLALNNASLSVSVLFWLTDIAIFALLWTKFLRHCEWKIRLLVGLFFVVNIIIGNIFPLGYRKRQALSILLGMGMFLTEKPLAQGALAFLALLAQPFTGAAMVALKAAELLEKKQFRETALLAIPLLLAYPFYSGLFSYSSPGPQMLGCGYLTPSMPELFAGVALAIIVFLAANRKAIGLVGILSAAMLLARPAAALAFVGIKDAFSVATIDSFLSLATIPCAESLTAVALFGMVLLIYRRKAGLPAVAAALMMLVVVHNTYIIDATLLSGITPDPSYAILADKLEQSNLTAIKTFEVLPLEYSGAVRYKPVWTIFSLQGYAMLHGYNLTFVGELNMPPQLSKGRSNIPASGLPQAIYERDAARCRNLTQELKAYGVGGVLYTISKDMVHQHTREDEAPFFNRSFLDGCGAENIINASDYYSTMLFYRLK